MLRFCAVLLAAALACGTLRADTLHLVDGRTIEGKVVQAGGSSILIETPMGRLRYPTSEVKKVEYGQAEASPGQGEDIAARDRARFNQAAAEAERAHTAAEGLAIWTSLLGQLNHTPTAQEAESQQALWRARVNQDLVRFGPQWIAREEYDRRNKQADEYLSAAEKTPGMEDALVLYDKAARAHPFRNDIPFAKAIRLVKADRSPEAVAVFSAVLRENADHPAAMANLGVLSAMQKQWDRALPQLLKAVELGRTDRMFDNLELAMWRADGEGYPAAKLEATDKRMRAVVADMHARGDHVGQNRWGNGWISQAQYEKYLQENRDTQKKLANTRAEMDKLEQDYAKATKAREDLRNDMRHRFNFWRGRPNSPEFDKMVNQLRDLGDKIDKMEDQAGTLEQQELRLARTRNKPPLAPRYVLLDVTGKNIAHALDPPAAPAPAAQQADDKSNNNEDNNRRDDNNRRRPPWIRNRDRN